jgi:hypothetical protein
VRQQIACIVANDRSRRSRCTDGKEAERHQTWSNLHSRSYRAVDTGGARYIDHVVATRRAAKLDSRAPSTASDQNAAKALEKAGVEFTSGKRPRVQDREMVRLSISFGLALLLILSGAAVQRVAFIDNSPLKFAVSVLAIGFGLVWLWAIVKEWRTT